MANYQPATGSTIGNLLRAIQEDKSQSPLEIPPSSEVGSPIRDLVQQPVFQAESPDSARVASIRPGIEQLAEPGTVVPPVQPEPVVAESMGPVGPATPSVSRPSSSQSSAARPTSVALPSLATKIVSKPSEAAPKSTGQVAGASTKAAPAPALNLNKAINSGGLSAPKPVQQTPQRQSIGQLIVQQLQGLGTKLNPANFFNAGAATKRIASSSRRA